MQCSDAVFDGYADFVSVDVWRPEQRALDVLLDLAVGLCRERAAVEVIAIEPRISVVVAVGESGCVTSTSIAIGINRARIPELAVDRAFDAP